jgi:hypothetical protein
VPGSFVWLGLHEPTYDEFDDLALYFAPHPLAIEDAVNAHQRPKLDIYDECMFVVLKTLDYDEAQAELVTGEIMLFTGENFMVTVQHGSNTVLEPVRRRLEGNRDLLRHGPSAVLYGICDAVVDDYEKIADDSSRSWRSSRRRSSPRKGAPTPPGSMRSSGRSSSSATPSARSGTRCGCSRAPGSPGSTPTWSRTSATSPTTWRG